MLIALSTNPLFTHWYNDMNNLIPHKFKFIKYINHFITMQPLFYDYEFPQKVKKLVIILKIKN